MWQGWLFARKTNAASFIIGVIEILHSFSSRFSRLFTLLSSRSLVGAIEPVHHAAYFILGCCLSFITLRILPGPLRARRTPPPLLDHVAGLVVDYAGRRSIPFSYSTSLTELYARVVRIPRFYHPIRSLYSIISGNGQRRACEIQRFDESFLEDIGEILADNFLQAVRKDLERDIRVGRSRGW